MSGVAVVIFLILLWRFYDSLVAFPWTRLLENKITTSANSFNDGRFRAGCSHATVPALQWPPVMVKANDWRRRYEGVTTSHRPRSVLQGAPWMKPLNSKIIDAVRSVQYFGSDNRPLWWPIKSWIVNRILEKEMREWALHDRCPFHELRTLPFLFASLAALDDYFPLSLSELTLETRKQIAAIRSVVVFSNETRNMSASW